MTKHYVTHSIIIPAHISWFKENITILSTYNTLS